jgi:hypothetical protein
MRIRSFVVGTFAGAALAAGVVALAGVERAVTIEGCAALMPAGKRYGVEISATADTTGTAARVTGRFSVSDPSLPKDLDGLPSEARAFVECVSGLIN